MKVRFSSQLFARTLVLFFSSLIALVKRDIFCGQRRDPWEAWSVKTADITRARVFFSQPRPFFFVLICVVSRRNSSWPHSSLTAQSIPTPKATNSCSQMREFIDPKTWLWFRSRICLIASRDASLNELCLYQLSQCTHCQVHNAGSSSSGQNVTSGYTWSSRACRRLSNDQSSACKMLLITLSGRSDLHHSQVFEYLASWHFRTVSISYFRSDRIECYQCGLFLLHVNYINLSSSINADRSTFRCCEWSNE